MNPNIIFIQTISTTVLLILSSRFLPNFYTGFILTDLIYLSEQTIRHPEKTSNLVANNAMCGDADIKLCIQSREDLHDSNAKYHALQKT